MERRNNFDFSFLPEIDESSINHDIRQQHFDKIGRQLQIKKDNLILESISEYLGIKVSFFDLVKIKDRLSSAVVTENGASFEQYCVDGNLVIEFAGIVEVTSNIKNHIYTANCTVNYRKANGKWSSHDCGA